MLQGTGSHVGKTVLTAAFCRAFHEAGYAVAPFKAQNMALNAYVTADGGEIGWAQAMQAEAARLAPTVDMNPILLKPETRGSQVVVHGRARATLSAREYYARRDELWAAVTASYRRLARAHDVVVIEGAGSPAEPNLMAFDLTNMAVARLAGAPVLLVGDIDRGGVFASLLGSLAWLTPADRRRVRGFIINKFRGDAELLAPALALLTARTRRPVLGVVPYVADLRLPEEDSVALLAEGGTRRPEGGRRPPACRWASGRAEQSTGAPAPLDVVVVCLPHIANFTDFAPLAADPAIALRYARRPDELAGAAVTILPGSKDTLADLRWLHATGFAGALRAHLACGGRLGGVCGGFQMLGLAVEDPDGLEGGGQAPGLGCLPLTTTLEPGKITRRVRARLVRHPEPFDAYEIHLGRTRSDATLEPFALVEAPDGVRPDGAVTATGRVWGTYLHGLFDAPAVRRALLGLASSPEDDEGRESYRAVREREYVRLAALVAEHVDLAAIQKRMGLS
jgi:adenosylcobyric acid synthase